MGGGKAHRDQFEARLGAELNQRSHGGRSGFSENPIHELRDIRRYIQAWSAQSAKPARMTATDGGHYDERLRRFALAMEAWTSATAMRNRSRAKSSAPPHNARAASMV